VDFRNRDNSVYDGGDGDAHGTHVAGTIAAVGGNGVGVAGVSWGATVIPAKFLDAAGGYTADVIAAIDYLTDLKTRHGMNVVATNNSWGGGGFSQGLLDAVTRAARANILFVAAAATAGPTRPATTTTRPPVTRPTTAPPRRPGTTRSSPSPRSTSAARSGRCRTTGRHGRPGGPRRRRPVDGAGRRVRRT
jgi:subtilisin family serine protease